MSGVNGTVPKPRCNGLRALLVHFTPSEANTWGQKEALLNCGSEKNKKNICKKEKRIPLPFARKCKGGSMYDGMNSELKFSSQVQVTTINLQYGIT